MSPNVKANPLMRPSIYNQSTSINFISAYRLQLMSIDGESPTRRRWCYLQEIGRRIHDQHRYRRTALHNMSIKKVSYFLCVFKWPQLQVNDFTRTCLQQFDKRSHCFIFIRKMLLKPKRNLSFAIGKKTGIRMKNYQKCKEFTRDICSS